MSEEESGKGPRRRRRSSGILNETRIKLRTLQLAYATKKAYLNWIVRYLRYHRHKSGQWIHPLELGSRGVNNFLSHLAVDRKVSPSTQNQALAAQLFLYTRVLEVQIRIEADRAKLKQKLPVVLSTEEVRALLRCMRPGMYKTMAGLLYGAGLWLMECCRLRVKDVDFGRLQVHVVDGKGGKDRAVPLPRRLVEALSDQLAVVRELHKQDLEAGAGWASLPHALAAEYPEAGRQLSWQYLFPSNSLGYDPRTIEEQNCELPSAPVQLRRHHVHDSSVRNAIKRAKVSGRKLRWP